MNLPLGRQVTCICAAVTLLGALVSCQKARPAWPASSSDDFVNATIAPTTTQATQDVAEVAQVTPNQLVFPRMTATDAIAAWPVGKPVLGNRASSPNSTNPFGFMRKVMAVSTSGNNVVVDTEPAALADIVTGSAHVSTGLTQGTELDVDPTTDSQLFPDYPAGAPAGGMMSRRHGYSEPGTFSSSSQALSGNLTASETFQPDPVTFTVFSVNDKKTFGGSHSPVTVDFQGSATMTSTFTFTPSLVLSFDVSDLGSLKSFDAEANGQLTIQNVLDVNVGVTAAAGTDPKSLIGLGDLLSAGPDIGALPTITLFKSKPVTGPTIVGIPTTFELELLLDCSWGIQASMNATVTGTLQGDVNAALTYSDKKWSTSSSISLAKSAQVSITAGGGVAAECGLTPRVLWSFADSGGPYIDVRGGVSAQGTVVETCNPQAPEDGRPDITDAAQVDATLEIQYGGELDALDGALKVEAGPYDVYDQTWTLWSAMETFPAAGVGWCDVQCQDGMQDGNETDVDCGANCEPCGQNKVCKQNSDCLSAACGVNASNPSGAMVCAGSQCTDGLQDGQETGVDCGGSTCRACPLGIGCKVTSDCESGSVCSAAQYGPQMCTENLCVDGVKDGTESAADCGGGCPTLCASGQGCNSDADCASNGCDLLTRLCTSNHCDDSQQDDGETDVDCGGACSGCAVGQGCNGGADCQSGFCNVSSGQCVANIHEDGAQNGGETGVDCGGAAPNPCDTGGGCQVMTDCITGDVCNPLTLACALPGCHDNVLDGAESGVDCGGPTCGPCALAKTCKTSSDCASNVCSGAGICVASACTDGAQDDGESDVDCGHVCGSKTCPTGEKCVVPSDCFSNLCSAGTCSDNACKDGIRDGTETDVDCGGSACTARCPAGEACAVPGDCASGLCSASHKCAATPCSDGVKDGTETDIDCGGSCATKCAVNKDCLANTDCASSLCNLTTHVCAASTCFDGIRDGSETAVDCGGSCPEKCAYQQDCLVATDCASGACLSATSPPTCAQDQCSDGIEDGDETGVDCGGSCPTGCGVGGGCLSGADCANPQGLVGVAGYCDVTMATCDATSCTDGVKDGTETDVDCGGPCAPCPTGEGCGVAADCVSTFCNVDSDVCVATQCEDGLRDGTETDIDCGGSCGWTCGAGKGCGSGYLDCSSGICSSANLCLSPLAPSCGGIFSNPTAYGYSASPASGVYTIDPDGPNHPGSTPDNGSNPPISTYCAIDSNPSDTATYGGWTPVMYLNSANINAQGMNDWGFTSGTYSTWDMNHTTWEGENIHTCTTDADCAANTSVTPNILAGSICSMAGGATSGVCTGTATVTGLQAAPGLYSVPTSSLSSIPASYMMNVIGTPSAANQSWNAVYLSVYRNNVLLWSSPQVTVYRAQDNSVLNNFPPANGYYYTPGNSGGIDLQWLRCAGDNYLSATTVPESNPISPWSTEGETTSPPPSYGSSTPISETGLNARCHGWSVYSGAWAGETSETWGNVGSVLNWFQETSAQRAETYAYSKSGKTYDVPDELVMWGAWVFVAPTIPANYLPDTASYAFAMGTCNTSGPCYPTPLGGGDTAGANETGLVHRKAQGSVVPSPPIGNTADELNNTNSGTEIQAGTTGLVFVWWAQ